MTKSAAKPKNLTKRQAAFRDAILAGYNPSAAYKKSFNAKGMSPKAISIEAGRVLRYPHVSLAISLAVRDVKNVPSNLEVLPAVPTSVRLSMEERLEEIRCAARMDPGEMFDDLNHFKSIRELPEHVRRAIAGFKVDPVSFITEVKFVDKLNSIRLYSQLAGDMPAVGKGMGAPPRRQMHDLSKLTDEELKAYLEMRKKTLVVEEGA